MPLLIHLDGPPGVGKSTVAQWYAARHPGTLTCDIDRLRTLIGGWADDFATTGETVRADALTLVRAHLDGGHDVVLPQMLARGSERLRFERAATDGGHDYLHLLLEAPPGVASSRFAARPDDELHRVIRAAVDEAGGTAHLDDLARRLSERGAAPGGVRIDASGDLGATGLAVEAAVAAFRRTTG